MKTGTTALQGISADATIFQIFLFGGTMKKLLVAAVLLVALGLAFGQGMSYGAGVSYGPFWMADGGDFGGGTYSETYTMPMLGFHVFADSKYFQVAIGYILSSSQTYVEKETGYSDYTENYTDSFSWLDLDLVAKLPINFGSFTLFPLAGIEYAINLSAKDSNGNDLKAGLPSDYQNMYDAFMIKAGLGADFPVSRHFYVRPEVFVGYKIIKSQWDTDYMNKNLDGFSNAYLNYWEVRGMVLVGYRL